MKMIFKTVDGSSDLFEEMDSTGEFKRSKTKDEFEFISRCGCGSSGFHMSICFDDVGVLEYYDE